MNLSDLLVSGAQEKEITLLVAGEEKKLLVYLRPLPFSLVFDAKDKKGNTVSGNELIAKRVANCYVNKSGEAIFTENQLLGEGEKVVPADVVIALHDVVVEENNLGKIYGNLVSKMSSGAS